MRTSQILQTLLSLGVLASGAVIARDGPDSVTDPEKPEAADPATPPKKLTKPSRGELGTRFEVKDVPTVPDACTEDLRDEAKLKKCGEEAKNKRDGAIAFSGGAFKWMKDNQCTESQKAQMITAAWDAHTLAVYADTIADDHKARDIALFKTWMGPDYQKNDYKKRISENFKRAAGQQGSNAFDIWLSCKDTSKPDPQTGKKTCDLEINGKSVGGYAVTGGIPGWRYYYITMCPNGPFWTTLSFDAKILEIEKELAKGETDHAQRAVWHKNQGQTFLHEMMHLDAVGNPHINDELVNKDEGKRLWAYGPDKVYQLAKHSKGGAERASVNADSYAWLANSEFFWDLTGYFPRPDNYKGSPPEFTTYSDKEVALQQSGMILDFGDISGLSETDLHTRRQTLVDGFTNHNPQEGPRALSIVLRQVINTSIGAGTVGNKWRFYNTKQNTRVECDKDSNLWREIIPRGDPHELEKLTPSDVDIRNIPWPGGIFKLTIDGEDCEYKCDGKGEGRLFCPGREITCHEDPEKKKTGDPRTCGSSREMIHAAVVCDL
ncbi:hypothetical protein M011DRAFT_475975 [Sporormia fimetaria CBS 119925]|uniref:Lysine-specific metallo-endopeptidase domain-containing protein n=1 Tax=Sporormia fimetaria CBS 119925 TaxID=1340428 RepID=A0A6A6VF53_9PLEO|nr:hypothetical protein M011DRAFT_475975 [Sporormia fimetaria CBS 119925]